MIRSVSSISRLFPHSRTVLPGAQQRRSMTVVSGKKSKGDGLLRTTFEDVAALFGDSLVFPNFSACRIPTEYSYFANLDLEKDVAMQTTSYNRGSNDVKYDSVIIDCRNNADTELRVTTPDAESKWAKSKTFPFGNMRDPATKEIAAKDAKFSPWVYDLSLARYSYDQHFDVKRPDHNAYIDFVRYLEQLCIAHTVRDAKQFRAQFGERIASIVSDSGLKTSDPNFQAQIAQKLFKRRQDIVKFRAEKDADPDAYLKKIIPDSHHVVYRQRVFVNATDKPANEKQSAIEIPPWLGTMMAQEKKRHLDVPLFDAKTGERVTDPAKRVLNPGDSVILKAAFRYKVWPAGFGLSGVPLETHIFKRAAVDQNSNSSAERRSAASLVRSGAEGV